MYISGNLPLSILAEQTCGIMFIGEWWKQMGGFWAQVIQQLGLLQAVDGPDPTYHDICYAGAGTWVTVPDCNLQVIEQYFSSIVSS
jgi:hypothetical protein